MLKISWRIWILIIALLLSLISIFSLPPVFLESGVIVKSIETNSSVFEAGIRQGDIITSVNSKLIEDIEDYASIMDDIFPVENKTKLVINTKNNQYIIFTDTLPNMTLSNIPTTKIKTGLDISGGARALVKPEQEISSQDIEDLIAITSNRLNVYGISDVKLHSVSDLSGNKFMLVEVAGATPADLRELISQQGKFEAKIGNETVFIGGEKDITYVGRSGQEALIESCSEVSGGSVCRFRFTIYLSEGAAQKHADITSQLEVNSTEFGRYLEKNLDLYLDNVLVDSLLISEDLKGRVTTQISIQGSGSGTTRQDAIQHAQTNMQKLQTILITGSLPYKLEIEKLDTISPVLGQNFVYTILIAGISAIFLVGIIILIRYRKFKASLALLLTSFSEILIILGIAALIKWNLDLPSIAGILAVLGTGVDQQIVILDESRYKLLSMKERLKRALFIIISAYFTSVVALLPLWWAGAGLLKGFFVTTFIGITAGVLITRPAFADIIKKLEE